MTHQLGCLRKSCSSKKLRNHTKISWVQMDHVILKSPRMSMWPKRKIVDNRRLSKEVSDKVVLRLNSALVLHDLYSHIMDRDYIAGTGSKRRSLTQVSMHNSITRMTQQTFYKQSTSRMKIVRKWRYLLFVLIGNGNVSFSLIEENRALQIKDHKNNQIFD